MQSKLPEEEGKPYFVYVLECADGTLYTGITTDVDRRVGEHNTKRLGARYTKSRRPVTCVHRERLETKSAALKREFAIKKLSRARKLLLFGGQAPQTRGSNEHGLAQSPRK